MKKIMFNSKYGLDDAVLEGRKTMTRRVITHPRRYKGKDICGFYVCKNSLTKEVTGVVMHDEDERMIDEGQIFPEYKIGEVVAIAQSYKDCGYDPNFMLDGKPISKHPGWNNKMFVKTELMKHFIKITEVKVERLQDISDEDCLKEGIELFNAFGKPESYIFADNKGRIYPKGWCTKPRESFALLIDKVSGKDTWESNPWVWAYEFELVKNK